MEVAEFAGHSGQDIVADEDLRSQSQYLGNTSLTW